MDLKRKFFNASVLPHVDYYSVLWQECTKEIKQKIEQIQKYGMRLILSQPPRTPSDGMRHIRMNLSGYHLRSGDPFPVWLSFITDKHHSTLLNW